MYTMIWVKSGMIDLSIDGVLVPINVNQMTFITPSNYIQLIEGDGDVQILQFKRELYFIRDNDHEVSCNGILYFGSQGIQTINLSDSETESFLHKDKKEKGVLYLLTWGGLRGGISLGLAMSLPESEAKDGLILITFVIVAFSIIVQGLSIGKLAERLQPS